MKIGDFGMSRQVVMRQNGEECCLERALSANVIGTAAYSAPELLLADSPVKKNRVDAGTVLKSDVSFWVAVKVYGLLMAVVYVLFMAKYHQLQTPVGQLPVCGLQSQDGLSTGWQP